MLPVYLRLKMSPVVLTCVAGLANGTMNILPWGGPTARAATALKLDVNDVFVPMVPSLIAGLIVVLVFAWVLGLQERNRLRATQLPRSGGDVADPSEAFDGGSGPRRFRTGRGGSGSASAWAASASAATPRPRPSRHPWRYRRRCSRTSRDPG
jgi:CitMHS family citrate-Mg2+:H+ or citrate-Ca2+:H+ symporter